MTAEDDLSAQDEVARRLLAYAAKLREKRGVGDVAEPRPPVSGEPGGGGSGGRRSAPKR